MEFNWKFRFSPEDTVTDPLGARGVITECCVGQGGTSLYLVRTAENERWWAQHMLKEWAPDKE